MAVVFGYVHGNERVHDNLLVLQSFGNRQLELAGHQALRLDALFEHRQADEAVGTDADRAGQFRRVVHGDSDQVVGADGLGGKICARSLGQGRGARLRGGDGQEGGEADEDRDQQREVTIRRCF